MSPQTPPARTEHASDVSSADSAARRWLLGLLLLAAALRLGVVWTLRHNLSDDRDVYLALAEGIDAGRGLSVPGDTTPTAYRPPLYPLLLAALPGGRTPLGIACLHVLLGVATVLVTWRIAVRLLPGTLAPRIAALVVALDPLLLVYTSFPMTETLATFLAAALLAAGLRVARSGGRAASAWRFLTGLLFGLNVLCRPTLWVFGALVTVFYLCRRPAAAHRTLPSEQHSVAQRGRWSELLTAFLLTAAGVLVVVAPWGYRNWAIWGVPIITTTHGGYTLLLGNNPAFYREVVDQPLGTVWDGSRGPGQGPWADGINREMHAARLKSEIERDRWMSRRAWNNIAQDVPHFIKTCGLRLLWFWNVVPLGAAAATVPRFAVLCVGLYYVVVFVVALCGLWRVFRGRSDLWAPIVLLIAGFTAVHMVYWSNARMRAPVTPAVALLAGAAFAPRRMWRSAAD